MKLKELSLRTITIVQLIFATILCLIFQFIVPLWWQPLDYYTHDGPINHGDPGANVTFFTISLWFFALSVAWFIYRDNKYLNNFLVYSIIPLGMIVGYEFFGIFLYYDYVHVLPVVVSVYLIWKKRDSLDQKYIPYYAVFLSVWLYSVYFLKLAYYTGPLIEFVFNWAANLGLSIALSFAFRKKSESEENREAN